MTLFDGIKRKLLSYGIKKIFTEVLNSKIYIHNEKIKPDHFILGKECMKVIHLGKATLILSWKVYSILPGSQLAKWYNTYDRHLAYELRNIPGSIYFCSYNIKKL